MGLKRGREVKLAIRRSFLQRVLNHLERDYDLSVKNDDGYEFDWEEAINIITTEPIWYDAD